MKHTRLVVAIAAFTVVGAVSPSAARGQQETASGSRPANQIGRLGFVWGGRPDNTFGTLRWASYPTVRHVFQTSPAQAAGLREGDRIMRVDGRDALEPSSFWHHEVGERLTLQVLRGDEVKTLSFVLITPNWPDSAWVRTREAESGS